MPKLCVVDLRCSGVDDTDVAAAIMTLDSREGACPVPVRAVADAAYRVCAENPRQLLPEYVDVRDFQGDVNRADIARVRVEPLRVAGLRRIAATISGVRYFSQEVAPLSIQAPPPLRRARAR
jgi:hypothetical protein